MHKLIHYSFHRTTRPFLSTTMPDPHSITPLPPEQTASASSQTPPARPREPERAHGTSSRGNWSIGVGSAPAVREETCSCFAVVFSFWLFVSMTMILGVYGSVTIVLGPTSSKVFQPSSVFVKSVKVENLMGNHGGRPILYGTYGYPPLDVFSSWGETLNVSLPSGAEKEWKLYLNRGSAINISYHVSSRSSSVFLIVAQGMEAFTRWLENPTEPNTTLSWNVIHGSGMITQEIFQSSSYYIALGNLDEDVKVTLNLSVISSLHNTTNAYYRCALINSPCALDIFFLDGSAAVLVTPAPQQNASNEWYIKLSYGPRWVTYIFGIGGLTFLVFWSFNLLNNLQSAHEGGAGHRSVGTEPQRAPLLSHKDDDLSSWGSSYDSLPQDEEDLDFLPGGPIDGKLPGDGQTSNNTRRLCAICFDAPRDCFFLPCGHCVACFACGTRIAEASGTCPVCRRNMKKVRKIFTV
ncbi:E3 ubiquitin-protein ligase APD2-like isoform X1 [Vigna umbellata]|uniref:E3 ubiquitin-protein ligase APD2-like isoform X1 n=1 Tax=Vigna umbellata TaxID=87088 RepID=UPI001F5E8BAD|nr:E3 ubiquitin-protein ligase APD2-like isoform X1 [Vigna umbellata]